MRSGRFVPIVAAAALLATLACNSATDPTAPAAGDLTIPKASFANDRHLTPGTPGDANCQGQSIAYLAQASKNGLIPEGFRGLAGTGEFVGLTVQEYQALVDAYCNPEV